MCKWTTDFGSTHIERLWKTRRVGQKENVLKLIFHSIALNLNVYINVLTWNYHKNIVLYLNVVSLVLRALNRAFDLNGSFYPKASNSTRSCETTRPKFTFGVSTFIYVFEHFLFNIQCYTNARFKSIGLSYFFWKRKKRKVNFGHNLN